MLDTADEATCRAWAARQGVQLDLLDRDLPAFADAMPMDLGADVARSDQRRRPHRQACATAQPDYGGKPCIRSFGMTVAGSFRWCGRNTGGRLRSNGAVTGPTASRALGNSGRRGWRRRSGSSELDRRGIAELEATGIPWAAVERWLDALDPREAFVARMFVKQVLQTLADDQGATERNGSRPGGSCTRRLIAAGIVD